MNLCLEIIFKKFPYDIFFDLLKIIIISHNLNLIIVSFLDGLLNEYRNIIKLCLNV